MYQKLVVLAINIIVDIYIAKLIYFSETTRLNLILGTILILGSILYILASIYMYFVVKKEMKKDNDIINEVLEEMKNKDSKK
ncbi:DUF202 domain-containing protein [Oceanivirga miroungae]|uniref:Uncharacterized protein n=1 Tax=Oceanivirga miroungae TaxID=1130046 RepID=A0A6I8M7G0_9FUSO|nr:DUF202 domain-containing protein [Oceanivirga miroungae]VWL84760.1 hypothetical protein OMES3154_00008 [Oceanivirga miroungae]